MASAVFGSLMFIIGFIGAVGFSGDYWTIVYILGIFIILSIYYFLFAHKDQVSSE